MGIFKEVKCFFEKKKYCSKGKGHLDGVYFKASNVILEKSVYTVDALGVDASQSCVVSYSCSLASCTLQFQAHGNKNQHDFWTETLIQNTTVISVTHAACNSIQCNVSVHLNSTFGCNLTEKERNKKAEQLSQINFVTYFLWYCVDTMKTNVIIGLVFFLLICIDLNDCDASRRGLIRRRRKRIRDSHEGKTDEH